MWRAVLMDFLSNVSWFLFVVVYTYIFGYLIFRVNIFFFSLSLFLMARLFLVRCNLNIGLNVRICVDILCVCSCLYSIDGKQTCFQMWNEHQCQHWWTSPANKILHSMNIKRRKSALRLRFNSNIKPYIFDFRFAASLNPMLISYIQRIGWTNDTKWTETRYLGHFSLHSLILWLFVHCSNIGIYGIGLCWTDFLTTPGQSQS